MCNEEEGSTLWSNRRSSAGNVSGEPFVTGMKALVIVGLPLGIVGPVVVSGSVGNGLLALGSCMVGVAILGITVRAAVISALLEALRQRRKRE
jgi:hypothetical protein